MAAEKRLLVTGGAGYIGSFFIHALEGTGFLPVVFDNFSEGHKAALPDVEIIKGDITSSDDMNAALSSHSFDAVVHFAGLCYVGESFKNPELYHRVNAGGSRTLLAAMKKSGISRMIFSSSCAVYGTPEKLPIEEGAPVRPCNPYGETKAEVETMMLAMHGKNALDFAALRYFNAAGASADGSRGEDHSPETHLIPLVLKNALGHPGHESPLEIFGTDYPTPDGTCVRDYIHVEDLASAHRMALEHIFTEGGAHFFNLGSGKGISVRELIAQTEKTVGQPVTVKEAARRPGDPPELTASNRHARDVLGWAPKKTLSDILESAQSWHRRHREGYGA